MKYKVITGYAHVDEEENPNIKDFNVALEEAINECYEPVFSTFRVTRVEGNVLFSIIVYLRTEPGFIGGDNIIT